MATIDIGKLTFTHKGDYAGGTAYVLNDVVYYNGSAYIAKTSTTGNLPTSTAHWNTFAAGSGGIWNAGLSLGTAGQVVKVNSGASALEFGTVSSDYVKIATADATGTPASIFFSDVFTNDYTTYQLFIDGAYASAKAKFYVRFTTSGTTENTAGYYITGHLDYYNYASNSSSGDGTRLHDNYGSFPLLEEDAGANDALKSYVAKMTFHNPRKTNEYKWCQWETGLRSDNSGYYYNFTGSGYNTSQSSVFGGIRIFPGAGVINGGRYTLYGIK